MKYLHIIFAGILCVLFATRAESKVTVSVYYESLCPDSIKFITKQLYPALQHDLSKYIDLNLYPYGKSSQTFTDNTWAFECHHGPNECYGNLIQACALTHIMKESNSNLSFSKPAVAYINCLMAMYNKDTANFTYPTQQCATTNNIQNVNDIEKCANGTEGKTLLSKLGVLTQALKPELKSVPTIVFDNIYTEKDQNMAVTNFPQALCGHIQGEKPNDCASYNGTSSAHSFAIMTVIMCIVTRLFI